MEKSIYDLFRQSTGVSIDSRTVEPGQLFFALKGENFDGNKYALQALEKGASAAVVSDPLPGCIVVPDTLKALQRLANDHRRSFDARVFAITGTNGKTTTKELMAAVLARKFRVQATQGNLNNHIGVPLTLLSVKPDTEFAIVEMGASAVGEIAALCAIAEPDYGLITNVGRAHLEGFGDEEGVKRGKGELYDYLCTHEGLAFIRRDDRDLMEMAGRRRHIRVIGYDSDTDAPTQLQGAYNRHNVAAALSVGEYFGVDRKAALAAVAGYTPVNHRSELQKTERGNTLTVDCYNANPSSMRAAIETFSGEVLILGDMLELGTAAEAEHAAVLALIPDKKRVLTVGSLFAGGEHYPSVEALISHLTREPLTDSSILLKGSRGIALEKLIPFL